MPEQGQFFFKRFGGRKHFVQPPTLQRHDCDTICVADLTTLLEGVLKGFVNVVWVVLGSIVVRKGEQFFDGKLNTERLQLFDLFAATTKSCATQQMGGIFKTKFTRLIRFHCSSCISRFVFQMPAGDEKFPNKSRQLE